MIIYTKENCPYCIKAKELVPDYTEIVVGQDITREEFLSIFPETKTVPQIIIEGKHVGGYTDLVEYLK
jgi:glutaredoxin 3